MKFQILSTLLFIPFANCIGQCENFEISVDISNPTCPGYSDGSLHLTPTGQNGSIQVEIFDELNNLIISNVTGISPNILSAGWYYYTVTDDLGCVIIDSVYIADTDQMEIMLNLTEPTHADSCNGLAIVDTVLNHVGLFENLFFFWSPGGPGGQNETIKENLCVASYTLIVQNEVGCSAEFNFSFDHLSFDPEKILNKDLSIYPNPSDGIILVESSFMIEKIEVLDLTGNLIFVINYNSANKIQIDMSNLKGVYLLKVNSSDTYKVVLR